MGFYRGPKIITNGLVLALDAANPKSYPGSGTTWTDISANGNNGTLTNGPTFNSGNGGSIVFDGSNDYVQISNNDGFGTANLPPRATISMWANIQRRTGVTIYQQLAGFRSDAGYDFFFLLLDTNSSNTSVLTEARLRTQTSIYDINVEYISYFNKWTNIVFVANTNRADLYFNGVLAGSKTSVSGNFGASSGNFRIGISPISQWPVLGNMSNVMFYNRALTEAEIQQNYNATRNRFGI